MTETIIEYFRRFDNSVTESIYSIITLDDYYRNKAAFEYLDYDCDNIFRKNKLYCGIRNIDNSCYLSATLQILYNIQWLRERIFKAGEQGASDFLRELQKLFGLMWKGTLVYVDPSDLFQVLKTLYPDVFIVGSQNDFHQVFTIILDQLEKSLTNQDDKKFFRKLFYGKMKVQLTDQKDKILGNANDTGNSFNLINLASEHRSFDQALKSFKNQIIEGYISDSGQKMKASKGINFIQTPGILSFFINRVTFKDKKLVKDNSEFDFEEKIMFAKTSNSKVNKISDTQIEKHINQLNSWISSINIKKQFLQKTLLYFEQQEFTNINTPNISNPLGQQAKKTTKNFIKAEIQGIEKQIQKASAEIVELQKKRFKQAQDNYTELYNIWAVMIHCGTTAQSGHYKMCVKVDPHKNIWVEMNDRRTEQISHQKIIQYKKKGQICCLFYRKNNLLPQVQKAHIPSSLKKYVIDQQQKLFKKIDNARIMQSLYQQYESISIIWEYENLSIRQQQKISTYFFKPLLHLILSNTNPQICKGYLLYQNLQQPKFIQSIKNKLIDKNKQIKVPTLQFGIPSEYWQISQALKQFLCLQMNNPIQAYQFILFYLDITIKNQITQQIFNMLKEVIVLKGIFYQCLYVQMNLLECYQDISKAIDSILAIIGLDNHFCLKLVPVRSIIQKNYFDKVIKLDGNSKQIKFLTRQMSAVITQATPGLFSKRFGYWIDQRKNCDNLQQHIFNDYKKIYPAYYTTIK